MPNRLKLLPDYECYALWDVDSLDNLDSRKLSISDELKKRRYLNGKNFMI
ncbi:hypothetical protein TUM17379_06670 [Shewanella algae]|uniref:Uncharacterized protein n=1 Tax=Shewanella algae TaxID=38313 RepID=A0AAD1K6C2_9GAMM|nr:hypothetical protein TUM17379_06670 [Shewanella algae]